MKWNHATLPSNPRITIWCLPSYISLLALTEHVNKSCFGHRLISSSLKEFSADLELTFASERMPRRLE